MLDHLSSRFNEKTELVYKAFAILPNYIIDSVYDGKGMHWRKNVMEFATFYRDDLSNYHLLDTELSTYHTLGDFQGNSYIFNYVFWIFKLPCWIVALYFKSTYFS